MSILATGALIAGGVQAVSGIGQLIAGAAQRRRAMKRLERLEDPQMEMPSSIDEMIELARVRAGSPMPGMQTAKDEMGARTSRGVEAVTRAARTPGEVAAATRELYAEEMRGARQLDVAGAEYRASREGELMRGLQTRGGYEQEMFRVNEMLPYQRRLQMYLSNAQVGGQNIAQGLGTAISAPMDALSNYTRMKMLEGWMPQDPAGDAGRVGTTHIPRDPQWIFR